MAHAQGQLDSNGPDHIIGFDSPWTKYANQALQLILEYIRLLLPPLGCARTQAQSKEKRLPLKSDGLVLLELLSLQHT